GTPTASNYLPMSLHFTASNSLKLWPLRHAPPSSPTVHPSKSGNGRSSPSNCRQGETLSNRRIITPATAAIQTAKCRRGGNNRSRSAYRFVISPVRNVILDPFLES